jgi:hypothetical protein
VVLGLSALVSLFSQPLKTTATNSTATYNPTSWNWMTKFKPSATNIIIPMVALPSLLATAPAESGLIHLANQGKSSATNIIIPMAALPSLLAKTKPKPSKNATATQGKKETTVVVYQTTCFHLVCNADLQPKYLIH